jgi:hypothetical protein
METTSDDKQVLCIKVLRIFIRPGWGIYLLTRRYRSYDLPFGGLFSWFSQDAGSRDGVHPLWWIIPSVHLRNIRHSDVYFMDWALRVSPCWPIRSCQSISTRRLQNGNNKVILQNPRLQLGEIRRIWYLWLTNIEYVPFSIAILVSRPSSRFCEEKARISIAKSPGWVWGVVLLRPAICSTGGIGITHSLEAQTDYVLLDVFGCFAQ